MASITSYKCSKNCGFRVRLSYGMPIWKKGAPEYAQAIPVGFEYRKYVSGYFNEKYCVKCRSAISIPEKNSPLMRRSIIWRWISRLAAIIIKPDTTDICPGCSAKNSFLEEDMECPNCKAGKIYYDDARTIRF